MNYVVAVGRKVMYRHCPLLEAPIHSCGYLISRAAQCKKSCRYRARASVNIHIEHQNEKKKKEKVISVTLIVARLMVPDGLV